MHYNHLPQPESVKELDLVESTAAAGDAGRCDCMYHEYFVEPTVAQRWVHMVGALFTGQLCCFFLLFAGNLKLLYDDLS